MLRYASTAAICLFLAAVLVFGHFTLCNSGENLLEHLNSADTALKADDFEKAKTEVSAAKQALEISKKVHFALSEHETFEMLSHNLTLAEFFLSQKEKSLAGACIALARENTEEFTASQQIEIGNIL